MVYKLTQKDIDEYNLQGALVGEEATPEDLRIMDQGLISTMQSAIDAAPDAMQVQPSPMSNPAADTGPQIGDPQFTETPQQAAALEAAQAAVNPAQAQLLSSMQPVSADPFEGLSKNQRLMLAFAAVRDAGAALQGKQSSAFEGVLGQYGKIRDMERKRQAQQAQIAANQQMFNALGVGQLRPDANVQEIDDYMKKVTSVLATPNGAALAPFVNAELQRAQGMRQRAAEQQGQITNLNLGVASVDALLNSPDLGQITGFDGTVNEFLQKFGAAPEYSNLMSYVNQLQGLNFLEAYQSLKGGGPITDIEGRQATAARTRLEQALKGRPEDLVAALQEARTLFEDARMKNPQYQRQLQEQGSGIDPQLEDWYNKRLQTQQGN